MSVLMCPVCRQALNLVANSWQCEKGHHYDVAKQGYVNLHVVQHKHSKTQGIRQSRYWHAENFYRQVFISPYSR